MAKTSKEQQGLAQLQEENRSLRETCEDLQSAQAGYEQIIGDNNTNLLRSEMTRMELEQIFSAYSDAMWVVREDSIVVRANSAMLEILNKSADQVIGKRCSSLVSYELCQQDSCPLNNISTAMSREYDIQLNNGCAEGIHYLLTTAPLVTLDGTPGIACQFKDITSRKKAEAALEEANIVLKRMALVDGLTQIANRRCFDETLEKEWCRLGRNQKPLSLLLGDIDFFKKYNDHYGHQAGDDCLHQVAQTLAQTVHRSADLAARYGGEEFVLLLPDVDLAGALHVGQKALSAIERLGIEHLKSEVSQVVTISIGAATLTSSQGRNPSELISLADVALYQAKELGRNQLAVARQTEPPVATDEAPPQSA